MIYFFKRLKLFVSITLFAVLSWIIVHVLAIFGAFIAIAYPLLWFLSPKHITCLSCRARKDGEKCLLCKQPVNKTIGNAPKTFLSAVLNGFLIMSFSILSVVIIFFEVQFIHKLEFPLPSKTVSFSIPTTREYHLEEIFPMKLEITDVEIPINAIQADISFNPQNLEVVDISTKDSFANIFIQKEINNKLGYARLVGGLPNPGFSGKNGVLGTVFLRGKKPGLASVKFLPTSMILANDAKGTNVLKDFATISYLILPEKISNENTLQKYTRNNSGKNVLGANTTNSSQMIFYDEGKVLGENQIPTTQENQSIDIANIFLTSLDNMDNNIIAFWRKII